MVKSSSPAQLINHRQQLTLHDPYLHLRMLLMKAADHRRHQRPGDAGAKANINLPGLFPPGAAAVHPAPPAAPQGSGSHVDKNFRHCRLTPPPGCGGRTAGRKALLQLFNRFGQRRLRDRQRPAGATDTAFPGYFDEGANLMKFNLKCHAFSDNRCLSDRRK